MIIKQPNNFKEKMILKLSSLINKLDNSGNAVFSDNGEEKFIEGLFDHYKTGNFTMFDVGSNFGCYSQMIIGKNQNKLDFNLHLFEPQRKCAEVLKKKFGENKMIFINNFGLSDRNEAAVLHKNEDGSSLGSLYERNLDFYDLKMNDEETVELKTAKEYIENNKITKINLLKIDAEGHELKVLAGFEERLNPSFIDFIQFEYGGANIDSHTNLLDFYNLLIPRGFKIAKIMSDCLELRDYNPRFDNFTYQNYVAVGNI